MARAGKLFVTIYSIPLARHVSYPRNVRRKRASYSVKKGYYMNKHIAFLLFFFLFSCEESDQRNNLWHGQWQDSFNSINPYGLIINGNQLYPIDSAFSQSYLVLDDSMFQVSVASKYYYSDTLLSTGDTIQGTCYSDNDTLVFVTTNDSAEKYYYEIRSDTLLLTATFLLPNENDSTAVILIPFTSGLRWGHAPYVAKWSGRFSKKAM